MKSLTIKFLIATLVAIVTAFFCSLAPVQNLEAGLADRWFALRGKIDPPQDIAIIAIDERSYDQLKVPLNEAWPRALHASLLEKLAEYGVKRVVFDILFIGPSALPQSDQQFAKAIANVPTVLGVEASTQQISGAGGSYVIEDLLSPYEPFLEDAIGTGLVGLPTDQGTIRRFLTERSEMTREIPSLSEAGVKMEEGNQFAYPHSRDLINYYGPARSIPIYSYYQILDSEKKLPRQVLQDKIVFVGLLLRTEIGPAQKDIFRAPFGGNVFGVEVHATAAANLLDNSWIRRKSLAVELLFTTLIVFVSSVVLFSISPLKGFAFSLLTAFLWALVSFFAFRNGLFIPGLVPILIVLPLTLLLATLYYYFVTKRSEQTMRSAFELYLSPDMVKSLDVTGSASLGGEKLWATALFTDIVGFTQITEEMPAERVAQMLNDYFTEVMEVVFRNQGTLIKFIGDAVFVIWGAPIKIQNHAERAIETALAIDAEVRKFNASGRFPALNTRIGINTGPMLVGNLGSKRRFDYTAIGDSVNLASRVEGINKYIGTSILFTEATRRDAGESVFAIKVGAVKVAGKKEVVELYTSFSEPLEAILLSDWTQALVHFANCEWKSSEQIFHRIEQQCPPLASAAVRYREIIAEFVKNPPEPGWSGEIAFSNK